MRCRASRVNLEKIEYFPYVISGWAGAAMPEIERFGGFKLLMFFQDENPPHVHIAGPDFAAKIRISDGSILAGTLPRGIAREAREWIASHRAELLATWDEFSR
jgi:hypothetical protein